MTAGSSVSTALWMIVAFSVIVLYSLSAYGCGTRDLFAELDIGVVPEMDQCVFDFASVRADSLAHKAYPKLDEC